MSGKNLEKSGHYGVQQGRATGVYGKWGEAKAQVDGYSNAAHKNFSSDSQAKEYVAGHDPCPKERYYAVQSGRNPGVYDSWEGGARAQVDGYNNAQHKSFSNASDAHDYVSNAGAGSGKSGGGRRHK